MFYLYDGNPYTPNYGLYIQMGLGALAQGILLKAQNILCSIHKGLMVWIYWF